MKVIINEKEHDLPEIIFFKASADTANNREVFSLDWEVKNATQLELYRNGIRYERLNGATTSRQISETYDGMEKEVEYSLVASNDDGGTRSLPVSIKIIGTPRQDASVPEIIFFRSSAFKTQNREPFLLEWEVRNATQVDLYRNSIVFAKLSIDKTSREIAEIYDGRDKNIIYSLIAINDTGQVESDPITVTITNKVTGEEKRDTEAGTIPPVKKVVVKTPEEYIIGRDGNIKKIRIYLLGLLAGIVVLVFFLVFIFSGKPRILDFDPKMIAEDHTVVISGKNFPLDSNQVQVLFNKVRGKIQYMSPEIIRVTVPRLADKMGDGSVTLALVVKGDTSNESAKLVIIKRESQQDILPPEIIVETGKDTALAQSLRPAEAASVVTSEPVRQPVKTLKKTFNMNALVKASHNFRRNAAGGTDLRITIQNDSPFDLDNVHVEVTYFRKNKNDIQKETLVFPNVRAHLEISKDIPDGNPGSPVTFKTVLIQSKQLDKHQQG